MIGVKDIRLAVDRLLAREQRGSTVSPSDFNRFLEIANAMEFSGVAKMLEANADITDMVKSLYKETYKTPDETGVVTLPTDCYKVLGVLAGSKPVDRVSYLEYSEIKNNSIAQPTTDYPVYYIREGQLIVDPILSQSLRIGYVKDINTPYLDYYINGQKNIVYLDEGETVDESLIDGDFMNYGNDGSPITISNGLYTSQTVELEWDRNENRVNILNNVLRLCGISEKVNINTTGYEEE